MANIVLTWTLPAVSERQRPIARVLIEISAAPEEAGWTEHRVVPADAEQTVTMVDAAPGTHHYRLTAIDTDGRRSVPVTAQVTVAHQGPSPVTDVVVRVTET